MDHVGTHLIWLWLWFQIGIFTYMVKRAFYLITGPNPVADNVGQFIRVAGVPLFFRWLVDSGIYWACFSPETVQAGMRWAGWNSAAFGMQVVTQFAVFALFFGLGVDPLVDWATPTLVAKIPFLKDWWPQMPSPLKAVTIPETGNNTEKGVVKP